MQKKIIAVAVAGLSTAAFAQTNVTIYGVADVSGQGYNVSQTKATTSKPAGNVFALENNSSLIGFKGTEDLGNGLKALFQAETNINITGTQGSTSGTGAVSTGATTLFSGLRDSYVGLSSKYGTGMAGFMSTPLRASLNSYDVMPGATGSGRIEHMMSTMKFNNVASFASSVRATAVAYAMPTLYGFDASIAYTGSNNNGINNSATPAAGTCANSLSTCTAQPQSVFGLNLGWTGYGVNVKGAFQQANQNFTGTNLGDYTSYLVGAGYTGIAGLKLSGVFVRNTLGTTAAMGLTPDGAGKITNNQFYTGASYRMGNWEPRVSAVWSSDVNGSNIQQLGSRQWTANVGYYMSKRTQVYGLVSNVSNSANQNFSMAQQSANLRPTNGQNEFTYGMGMRTSF
jgi:predicted porin